MATIGAFVFVMTMIGNIIAFIIGIILFPESNKDTYDWKGRVVNRNERTAKNINFNRYESFKKVA